MEEKNTLIDQRVPLWVIGATAFLLLVFIIVWAQVIVFLTRGNLQTSRSLVQPLSFDDPNKPDTITVSKISSRYKSETSKPSGWFRTGQDADILLSGFGFNNARGALSFNHLGIPGSDGKYFFVPDRFNNRVLIWKSLPVGNTPPDLVLGQKDFVSNNAGDGRDEMNWPVTVTVSPDGKVAVSDTMNYRILVWNSLPVKNGQPADIVLSGRDGPSQNKKDIVWPWGVWTDGKKLVATSTRGSAVLIWNQFPSKDDQSPNIYLTANGKLGTPRTITSDGNHLIVSDHNAKVPSRLNQTIGDSQVSTAGIGKQPVQSRPATFFWKKFPTQNDELYDFYLDGWLQGDIDSDGKLFLIGATVPFDSLMIWDTFPENENDQPDIGDYRKQATKPIQFETGDASGIKVIDGKIYLSLYNGNRIVGYNTIPSSGNQQPDFAIGAPDIATNTLKTNYFIQNGLPATDGKSLFVSSDFDRKLYVWKTLPGESGAKPDFVYDFFGQRGNLNFAPVSITVGGNALVLAGRGPGERQDIYVWKKLPLGGELPDLHFEGSIGQTIFKRIKSVAIDQKYFYISDEENNKVHVFEEVPQSTDAKPKFSLTIEGAGGISSDSQYLLVSTTGATNKTLVYEVKDLSDNAKPIADLQSQYIGKSSVYAAFGRLFATSVEYNQVRAWKDIKDAISGKAPDVILGATTLDDITPEIGQDKLFWPNALAFDGSFLWVGEVKFSNRLLRFSVR